MKKSGVGRPRKLLQGMPPRVRQTAERSLVRQAEALRLRMRGYTVPAIADEMGVTVPTAWKWLQYALDDCAKATGENALRWRELELQRLDAVISGHWTQATGTEGEEPNVHAAAVVIKCVSERSKLLGLYLTPDMTEAARSIEVSELRALLLERQQAAISRARAAGVVIELPPPSPNGLGNGAAE